MNVTSYIYNGILQHSEVCTVIMVIAKNFGHPNFFIHQSFKFWNISIVVDQFA